MSESRRLQALRMRGEKTPSGRRKLAFIALVLLISIASVACERKDALVFLRDVAVTNQKFQQALTTARAEGFVAQDDYVAMQRAIKQIALYDDAAVSFAEQGKNKNALEQADLAIAEVDRLMSEGLLGVKNENKRLALQAILLTLRGTMVSAKALLT